MIIIWEEEARETLQEIYNYHSEISEKLADEFYNDIVIETKRLADFPQIAKIEPLLTDEPETYRSLIVRQHYKFIYFINEKEQEIVIVRIWDCRQDPAKLRIEH